MRPGRSAQVLSSWLQEREPSFREKVQVVTMDGFTGYASAVDQVLPEYSLHWGPPVACPGAGRLRTGS
ncbi:transposase [Corynebacterium suedekumii]|nr:transposase [Corynebacterium suedekumii]